MALTKDKPLSPQSLALTVGCAYLRDSSVKKSFRVEAGKQEFVFLDFRQLLFLMQKERSKKEKVREMSFVETVT